MMTNCPVCGKLTCIHWPEHWVYRRGSTYYCGEQCMSTDLFRDMQLLNEVNRRKRKEIIMTKITLEQKKKAVEIAINGGNPLEFLKKCGSGAPDKTWWAIKDKLKVKDPELYAKIPDMRKKTEPVATVKVDGPIRIQTETPEKVEVEATGTLPDVTHPVVFDGMTVREIEGNFGRYRRSDVSKEIYIDFEFKDINDTISMTVDQWRLFQTEMERAAAILGVKL